MKTKAITEGALMAALTIITALISYYLPFLTFIVYFAIPLPTIILYKRYGFTTAAVESIVSSLLLILFMGPLDAIFLAANIVLPGLLIGYTYKNNKTGGQRIIYGYFAFLGALIVEIVLIQLISNVSFMDSFLEELKSTSSAMIELYQSTGVVDSQGNQDLVQSVNELVELIEMIFPTMFLLIPALISWISILVDDFFFKRLRLSYIPVVPITQWSFPRPIKTLMAITFLVVVIMSQVITNEAILIYPYTIEMILVIIYLVMGFATVFWFMEYKFHKKMIFLRIIIVGLCFFVPSIMTLVLLLGVIDIFFNIRKFFNRSEQQ